MTATDHKTAGTLLEEEWEQLDCFPDRQAGGNEIQSDCPVATQVDAGAMPCEGGQHIDLELDDFVDPPACSPPAREDLNLIELPEMDDLPCVQPGNGPSAEKIGQEEPSPDRDLDPEWSARDDRLSSTIKNLTGWTLLTEPDVYELVRFPVFSDGVRSYRFGLWKILVSFHRMPGIALVDWSPESLEDDLKNATMVQPESYDVRRVARELAKSLSPAQIQELVAMLKDQHS
jgi:hypothetical protein